MADEYLRISLEMLHAENADFSDADELTAHWDPEEQASVIRVQTHRLGVTTGGKTLNLDHMVATDYATFAIKNTDKTNYINATVRLFGDADDADLYVRPGGIAIVEIDPVTDPVLTANGATCICRVAIVQRRQ